MKCGLFGMLAIGLAATAAMAAQKLGEPLGDRPPGKVYADSCGYCHGVNAGPIILGRALDPEIIRYMVRHGPNAMPAFRRTEISEAELDALALWISESRSDPGEHGR